MSDKEFPYEIRYIDPKLTEELKEYFKGERTDYVYVGPKNYFFPHMYKQLSMKLYSFEVKPTDVYVISFARSGTTWTQELVWMIANDLDYAKSDAIPLIERYPFLENSMLTHPEIYKELVDLHKNNAEKLKLLEDATASGIDILSNMPSPRFIKTHMPMSLLPPNLLDVAKVVYVARDPRDVAVSFYHLQKDIILHEYVGDFKRFWGYFVRGICYWAPFFTHLKEAWENRNHPNMLFLFYEELSKDLPAVIGRVSKFFNKQYTDDEVQRLCDHLSFENFKNNKSINGDELQTIGMLVSGSSFVRKGKSGGWREYFDEEMTQQAEQWIADNLRDTELRFPR